MNFVRALSPASERFWQVVCMALGLACAWYLAVVFEVDRLDLWLYDFRIFREGGRRLLAGTSPYEVSGFFSPLPLAVLFAPLAWLPMGVAYAVWVVASLALLWRAAGRRAGWALLSFPVLFTLYVGQVDLFLALAAAVFGPLAFPLLLGKPQIAFVTVPWLLFHRMEREGQEGQSSGAGIRAWIGTRRIAGIAAALGMLLFCFWLRPGWFAEWRAAAPPLAGYASHDSNLYRLVPDRIPPALVGAVSLVALALGAWLRRRRDSWAVLHLVTPVTNVYSAAVLAAWFGPLEMLVSWAAFLTVAGDVHQGAPMYLVALALLLRRRGGGNGRNHRSVQQCAPNDAVCEDSTMNANRPALLSTVLLLLLLLGPGGGPLAAQLPRYQIRQVTGGLNQPVGVTHAGDGSGRLFIVEQTGRIRIWRASDATLLATPFLDLSGIVGPCASATDCGERGLLGLAFHPDYPTNGLFYVYYTQISGGDVAIARYSVSANPNVANTSGTVLLTIEHSSATNHNGGQLAFGPDGFLYAGVGDGGGGGDPFENGQNRDALLGKILRLDIDRDDFPADPNLNYGIPAGNPFVGTAGRDEVWTWGMRNPWRFSFDRLTGDLFIGDVGQDAFEEIDFQAASSAGGENYGWDCREGAHVYTGTDNDGNAGCDGVTFVDPILEYAQASGNCSVTGGFVYRGLVASPLSGNYLFGDFCTGRIWRGVPAAGGGWSRVDLVDTNFGISSFGEGETGRLYFTDLFGDTLQWIAPYTFLDVTPDLASWPFVEALFAAGVTGGCRADNFCPGGITKREQMAVFLLRSLEGPTYTPPPCTTPAFNDVPCSSPFAPWINEIAARNVTAGCGGGNFCPAGNVSREQMSVFLLRTLEGSAYVPPACTTPVFADVPCSSPFAPWINEIAARGITAGCGGGNFCPKTTVTRAEMAVFLVATFELPVP
jgi:glucose/arabinose dehydrogenase